MNLEGVKLNEEKDKCHMLSLIHGILKNMADVRKQTETDSQARKTSYCLPVGGEARARQGQRREMQLLCVKRMSSWDGIQHRRTWPLFSSGFKGNIICENTPCAVHLQLVAPADCASCGEAACQTAVCSRWGRFSRVICLEYTWHPEMFLL